MGILTSISTAFHKGGWGMWPILITSIFTIAVIVERAVYLFKASVDKDKLLALLKSQVMAGNVQGAIKVCSGNPTPMTRIVQAGLMKFNKSDEEVQAAMDEAALRELPKINARTPYLAMTANFAVMAGNIQGAIKVCSGNPTPITRIIQAGLTKFNRPDAEVQAAMDEAALREIPKLEKRTGYLAMLGNVATLVGLLGTIIGLINSFAGVAGVDPSMKATLLAKGISEAMNCTAFGLITAAPALLAFSVLNGWTQTILDDINEVSVSVLNLVLQHRQSMKG